MRRFFLLSIKPEYSDRIYSGTKKFELRKRRIGVRRGDIVVVYTSSPTQAVNGAFMAVGELELPPDDLWKLHGPDFGIARTDYDRYFEGATSAVAIAIGRTVKIPSISLPDLRQVRAGFTPPQSFMYCPDALRDRALAGSWDALIKAA